MIRKEEVEVEDENEETLISIHRAKETRTSLRGKNQDLDASSLSLSFPPFPLDRFLRPDTQTSSKTSLHIPRLDGDLERLVVLRLIPSVVLEESLPSLRIVKILLDGRGEAYMKRRRQEERGKSISF